MERLTRTRQERPIEATWNEAAAPGRFDLGGLVFAVAAVLLAALLVWVVTGL